MGVLIGPNTLYYVIVRPKGKLREDFDFSDEKVRKPALLRPEMGERGTGDMATTVIAITNQKGGVGKDDHLRQLRHWAGPGREEGPAGGR